MIDESDALAPRARSSGLVVRELEDEVLIFDVERNQAHCLNGTAGLVWTLCDGKHSVQDIRYSVEQELGTPASVEVVWKALVDLDDEHLLDEAAELPETSRMSRKDLMKRAGATIAVPVIASLAIPSRTFALGSAGACGGTCTTCADCSSCQAAHPGTCGPGAGPTIQCHQAANACPAVNVCCVNNGGTAPGGCSGTGKIRNCACCSGKCDTATGLCSA